MSHQNPILNSSHGHMVLGQPIFIPGFDDFDSLVVFTEFGSLHTVESYLSMHTSASDQYQSLGL